jgi:hypothetical protein
MTELMAEDAEIRSAAFAHVRRLQALNDHINSDHLRAGFAFQGVRLPLINPQRVRRQGLVRRPTPRSRADLRRSGCHRVRVHGRQP